jgi:hypothetical protein
MLQRATQERASLYYCSLERVGSSGNLEVHKAK